jgi:conjugative relaxase-like TrwC/TraI family protein
MAKIKGGEKYLTRHLEHNDYYSENERVTGKWVGSGAAQLGLSGDLRTDDPNFEALRLNLDPLTWEPLTLRTNTTRIEPDGKEVSNRVAFYDFQCSAQKSVSIMAILAGDRRLIEAHQRASESAFKHMEEYAACRMGEERLRISSGNLVAARFQHDSSRQLDPQLHSHFVVANATFDGGEWRALETYDIIKYIDYFGRIYQSEMALACRRLGYNIVQTEKGYEIEDVSPELCEKFSKRSQEVEKAAAKFREKHGREPSVRERNLLARETRPDKLTEIATPEVRSLQWNQLTDVERRQISGLRRSAIEREVQIVPREVEKALDRAKALVFERVSVVERRQLLAAALFAGLGQTDLETISKTALRGDLLFRGQEVTTMEHLQAERRSILYVKSQSEAHEPLVKEVTQDLSDLSSERQDAVKLVLSSKAGVMAIEGKSGVGKTTVLDRIERELGRNHQEILFLAPTTVACQSLEKSVSGPVMTLQRFLQSDDAQKLARNRLVVVDEVSLVSTFDGARLLGLAERLGFRVLLVGDAKQMLSVQAGDWFRVLLGKADLPRASLTDIIRQKPGTIYHAIVTALSNNHVASALQLLETTSAVNEGPRYCAMAARHYVELTDLAPGSVDLIAPTWHENYAITDEVRKLLKESGRIRQNRSYDVFDSARWETERKASARHYEPGQAVTFIRDAGDFVRGDVVQVRGISNGQVKVMTADGRVNHLPLSAARSFDVGRIRTIDVGVGDTLLLRKNENRLVNGHVSTVESIAEDGTINLKSGMAVPPTYTAFTHGYCLTAFRSQSRTTKHVIVAGTNMDARSFYTALSRGRVGCDLFTPDFKLFKEQMKESLPRRSATDLILQTPTLEEKLKATNVQFQEYLRKIDEVMREPSQPLAHKMHALVAQTRESWAIRLPMNQHENLRTMHQAYVQLTSPHRHEHAGI